MRALDVVIRTDASPTVAPEHAARSLPLAEALRAAGHTVALASASVPLALRHRFEAFGVTFVPVDAAIGSVDDAQQTTRLARARSSDWILADGSGFNLSWQRAVRRGDARVLMLDDHAARPAWDADVILNPNIGSTIDAYTRSAPTAVVLAGASYALIGSEFSAWRAWSRQIPIIARRVLVMLSEIDPHNLNALVIAAIQASPDITARIVVDAINPHVESLRTLISADPDNADRISVLTTVEDIPSLMAWGDVAITEGGTRLAAIAAMQLPALVVHGDRRNTHALKAYVGSGAAWSLGAANALQASRLHHMIAALCDDHTVREHMARAGARLVDGGGAERVRGLMESWR